MGITLTDVLLFGKAQSDDVDKATLVIYRRNILRWSALGGYLDIIVKGVSPLSLPDAIADSLSYVKAFGGTEQNGTPTPDAPVDIVSNNGVLRTQGSATGTVTQAGTPTPTEPIYPVFYQKGNLVLRAVDGYADTYDATTKTITRKVGVKVLDGTEDWTYVASFFSISLTDVNNDATSACLCTHYLGVAASESVDLYTQCVRAGRPSGTYNNKLLLKDSNFTSTSTLTAFLADQYANGTPVIVYYPLATTPTESFTPSVYTDGTVETIELKDANNLLPLNAEPDVLYPINIPVQGKYTLSANINNGSNVTAVEYRYYDANKSLIDYWSMVAYSDGRMYRTASLSTTIKYVSCTRKSDYSTATVTQIKLEKGEVMTPYFDGGTATAEMLLKVGDYQDVQSIIDGVVTRKVGVKVLDGTENWQYQGANTNLFSCLTGIDTVYPSTAICTHYIGVISSSTTNEIQNGQFKYGYTSSLDKIYIRDNTYNNNLAGFKAFLADQYNAGTPVIVIYPLATPTTETVTGQTLQVTDGDNTLEITQASLNGLELEAEYQAAVSLTIQEVQDANLDPNVEVTIN